MKTIFFLDKRIHLTANKNDIAISESTSVHEVSDIDELSEAYNQGVINSNKKNIYFICTNVDRLFDWFSGLFVIVAAAGGLVTNNQNEYLFIFRNDKWDLPKGKIEKGESIETAAVREVEEECGISQLKITKALPTTYHMYEFKGETVLKPTYWFAMNCNDVSELTPQTEEGITAVEWISPDNLDKVMSNTFDALEKMIFKIKS